MIANAKLKFLIISPTKVRQVIDLIRNKDVSYAKNLLTVINKRPKDYLLKVLNQAIANAKVKGIDSDKLYISKIVCDGGPLLKRFKAAAFGRAQPRLKKMSHITIELDVKS